MIAPLPHSDRQRSRAEAVQRPGAALILAVMHPSSFARPRVSHDPIAVPIARQAASGSNVTA